MSQAIPTQMRALLIDQYHEDLKDAIADLRVVQRAVPVPQHGQVLVKVDAAACNPSDLLLFQGKYGTLKHLPTVPGWEGTGKVVAAGGGGLAWWLCGKRVSCGVQGDRDGTWAEYVAANARECIPLMPQVPVEQAAGLIVNPLTAVGLLDTARRGGHRAAVHTAGASQLGRMLIALARRDNFPLINVVRRAAQVTLIEELGAELVLNSEEEGFHDRLRAECARLNATVAFEAVAGDMTGAVVNLMPPGSTVYVYGDLSEKACGNIDPIGLIFHNKTVSGFFLGTWIAKRGVIGVLRAARRVQRLMRDGCIETKIQRRLTLDEARSGLLQYVDHMTDGKVLIMPQLATRQ